MPTLSICFCFSQCSSPGSCLRFACLLHHWSIGCEFTAFDLRFKNRPQQLRVPLVALVVRYAIGFWIFTRDMRRAENDVPQKEHVPEVPFVVADAVIGRVGMMGVMCGGRRDQPLQHPRNGMQSL